MPTNDFLPFATGGGANVLSQASYEVLPALANGFAAGTANSAQVNKVLRQASIIAAALTQFVVDNSGQSAIDDGTIATIEANLKLAIQAVILAYNFAPLSSPALTGTPTAPTPATADNSTKIATTAMVKSALAPYAPLVSPAFGGTPSASTPANGDNSGKLATTSFVAAALGAAGAIYSPTFNSGTLTGLDSSSGGQLRMILGNYGVLLRNDGANFYILLTPSGAPSGSFNALRPITINLATGAVTIDATGVGSTFGATPTAPTMPAADSSSHLATTAYVQSQGYAARSYVDGTFWPSSYIGSNYVSNSTMNARFASGANSVGGWTRLWNGLLFQWGFNFTSGAGDVIYFPVSFANVYAVSGSDNGGSGHDGISSTHIVSPAPFGPSGFRLWAKDANGATAATNVGWTAIGN
jgi:hypothetical protein